MGKGENGAPVKRMLVENDPSRYAVVDLTAEEVQAVVGSIRARLAADDGIAFAYLHGSFLDEIPSHDVDVAVYFGKGLSDRERLDRCFALESELGHQLRLPVDVHAIDPGDLAFSFDAISGKVLFSRDEAERDRFEERAVALYLDYKPMLAEILRDLAGNRV